jgi:hypothetical protein
MKLIGGIFHSLAIENHRGKEKENEHQKQVFFF